RPTHQCSTLLPYTTLFRSNWLQENSDTIGPLVKVAGGAAVAVGGLALAVKGVQVARSITNTALIPFTAGVERLDKHAPGAARGVDRKSTRLNSSHVKSSYA